MIEVYMTNRTILLKTLADRGLPQGFIQLKSSYINMQSWFQVDAFFEAAATIVVASLTATPPVNLQEITKKLALVINVEIKILAVYSDIIILFLLE